MQLNLSAALKLLDSFRIPYSVGEGIVYLEQCYYDTNLLFLYRENFPLNGSDRDYQKPIVPLSFWNWLGRIYFQSTMLKTCWTTTTTREKSTLFRKTYVGGSMALMSSGLAYNFYCL